MPSNAAKGTYYRQRMKKWLEARGYVVAQMERMFRIGPGLFVKQDQLGADLLAVSSDRVLFVQVKMGGEAWRRKGLSTARREFEKFPLPPGTAQWIAVWEVGAREPLIYKRASVGGLGDWQDPPIQPALYLHSPRPRRRGREAE